MAQLARGDPNILNGCAIRSNPNSTTTPPAAPNAEFAQVSPAERLQKDHRNILKKISLLRRAAHLHLQTQQYVTWLQQYKHPSYFREGIVGYASRQAEGLAEKLKLGQNLTKEEMEKVGKLTGCSFEASHNLFILSS
eukprot:scaffold72642_cov17-Tisochrysis_lutea.AAC.2